MTIFLALGLFWIFYGVAGLLGLQVISPRYRGKPWTKNYIRFRGVSWLMIGIPWTVIYFAATGLGLSQNTVGLLAMGFALPAIAYSYVGEKKYKELLKRK